MIWLVLCILSSTSIFVIFKSISKKAIPALPVIVINYLIASAIGFIVGGERIELLRLVESEWSYLALLIGVLFIIMFFILGKSTREAGISVSTVASKMSVVIPISFSILVDPVDSLKPLKSIAIILAVLTVILMIYRKGMTRKLHDAVIYPLFLFAGMGAVDALVKYAQLKFITNLELSYFTAILFLISFMTGLVILVSRKQYRLSLTKQAVFYWGILLGIVNFGSIYFLIRALNHTDPSGTQIDSSIIFGINNTAIVLLSVLTGLLLFREKLNKTNYFGIGLSLITILLFSLA